MTIRTFKSSDSGVPTLNNAAGSLNNVLRHCLGTSGWAEAFVSGAVSAWRAPAGSRQYLRVDDTQTFAGAACYAYLRGFREMSDINTGTAAFPRVDQLALGVAVQRTNGSTVTGPRPWICVVGQTGFYFWYEHDSVTAGAFVGTGATHGMLYFGDVVSERDGQTLSNCLLAARSASTVESFGLHSSVLGRYMSAHPLTEQPLSTAVQFWALGISATATDAMGANANTGATDPITARVPLSPVQIYHDGSSGVGRNLVGQMPGLFAVHCSPVRFDTFSLEGGGRTFLVLPVRNSANNSQGRVVIETTSTQTW